MGHVINSLTLRQAESKMYVGLSASPYYTLWCKSYNVNNNLYFNRRHLKLRTESRRSRVRELWSIKLFIVTSANVVRFMPNFVHIIVRVYEAKVANLVMI